MISVTPFNSICSEVRPPKILGNLKANPKAKNLLGKGIFTGKHSRDNAFMITKNKKVDLDSLQLIEVSNIAKITYKSLEFREAF